MNRLLLWLLREFLGTFKIVNEIDIIVKKIKIYIFFIFNDGSINLFVIKMGVIIKGVDNKYLTNFISNLRD